MIVAYNNSEVDLLARIMRAEALGEGDLGMLMVGNVVINRILSNCLTFKNVRTITDAIYQKGQFVGINSYLFKSKATEHELELANRVLRGEYYYPATFALWFNAPGSNKPCKTTYYEGYLSGRYKNHCFFNPKEGECPEIY